MTIIAPLAKSGRAAAADLRTALQGDAFASFDGSNAKPKHAPRGLADDPPTVIARCETRQEVQLAIRTARAHGLVICDRAGDYGWGSRLPERGSMVLDLAAMRRVTVDPATRVAIVAGGATVHDVVSAAAAHGLTPVTGNCGMTSLASVTLNGGYGPLLGRHGLAADNLIETEIVLKNGQHAVANADRNADLFWALRGSGRNFGVTTSLRVRLYALPSLLSGMIFYPWSDADLVLRGYSEIAAAAPDCLTISAGIVSTPEERPLLFVNPTWCGDAEEGERVLAVLQSFGSPVAAKLGAMSYGDLLAMYDGLLFAGSSTCSKHTRRLPKLNSRVISAMLVATKARTSPLSAIILHHFHGAPARVRPEATGFGLRQEHFILEAVAAWHPSANDNGAGHRLWAQNLSDSARPLTMVGNCGSQLWSDRGEQVVSADAGGNARLSKVKQIFDPEYALPAIPAPCDPGKANLQVCD
jgi:hypothetical protein